MDVSRSLQNLKSGEKDIDNLSTDHLRDAAPTSSDLQFGFKPGHSNTLCTGILKCTISRYTVTHLCMAVFWMPQKPLT